MRAAGVRDVSAPHRMVMLAEQQLKGSLKEIGDLKEALDRALEELQPEQAGRQIQIVTGTLPLCQADAILLQQVYANLLSNALKHTRQKTEARIEIGWDDLQEAYFVKDNGAGFDMQYAGKLFGVFQRLHRAEEFEGIGVGLAIAQRILHRHGGKIWAQAEPGQGAVFYFRVTKSKSHD